MPEKKKVIIIGCGVAGISAAIELIQAGFDVEIFESKNFPGGRVYSVFDEIANEEHDNGQHLISGAYSHFLKILKVLGTDNLVKKQLNLRVAFSYSNGEKDILDGSPFKGKIGLLAGLLKLKKISLKSKFHITTFFSKLQFNKLEYKDKTVRELLIKNHQTGEAIQRFWEPLALATLNSSIDNAPAELLIEVLKKAFFSDKETSNLIFPNVGLSSLLAPFTQWFSEKGGKIHFGQSVKKLIIKEDKVEGIETKIGDIYYADYFISTVQPNSLLKVISNSETDITKFNYLKNFDFSTIISIYLWLDISLKGIDFSAMIGTKTQWLFNRREILNELSNTNKNFKGHLALTISAGNDLSNEDSKKLAEFCFDEVKSCFPELKEAKILHKKVIKDKFATVRLTQKNLKFRPKPETYLKNFFLAGDWTDTNLPATIEGAALSGRNVISYIKIYNP